MKRVFLALLVASTLANAGVIIVDEKAADTDKNLNSVVPARATESPLPTQSAPEGTATTRRAGDIPTATKTSTDLAKVPRNYQLKNSDINVRLAMKRWLKEVNMQLAYEAPNDFNVPIEAEFNGTISEAVASLMTSLKKSTYPLRACEYDNRVILVLHRAEECPLENEQ